MTNETFFPAASDASPPALSSRKERKARAKEGTRWRVKADSDWSNPPTGFQILQAREKPGRI